MDFELPPKVEDYRARIRAFVDTHIIPLESDRANYDEHENIRPDVLEKIRAIANRRWKMSRASS